MGEALISRAAGEQEAALPMAPGYHTIGITLRDQSGKVVPNWLVRCNDGSTVYTYNTNERGRTIFMCNSGAANIFINNYVDGYQYLDISAPGWTNIDAPVGLTTSLNINFTDCTTNQYDFTSNKLFAFMLNRTGNIYIVGGGGGGGMGGSPSYASPDNIKAGGGGGAGYLNNYIGIDLYNRYNFISGIGGRGGYYASTSQADGNTGGTSYIVNTTMSAAGGSGGNRYGGSYGRYNYGFGGTGGLGNGGTRTEGEDYNDLIISAGNSYIDFAGGGGGAGRSSGGTPYGGNGADHNDVTNAESGSRGGGGGGGFSNRSARNAGNGGRGMMRINFSYN